MTFYAHFESQLITVQSSLYTLEEMRYASLHEYLMHGRIQTNKPSTDECINMVTLINKIPLLYSFAKTVASDQYYIAKKVVTHWF